MNISKNIFRAYDIRGIYPLEVNVETALLIGRAYATYLIRKTGQNHLKIVVSRDNRTHGEELITALIKGLMMQGCEVSRVQDSPSPLLYFKVCTGGYDGGINVTASHNSAEYNGFKLVGKNAHSIAGEEIQKIVSLILSEDFEEVDQGSLKETSIEESYFEKITSIIQLQKKIKVVVDAGNGIAGKYYPELFRRLGCDVRELYCEQDGNFPNHEPDPVREENTNELKKIVLETSADIGISFDGDGDRCAIIDEGGKYHDANESFVLLIRDILSRHKGANVIYTVSNSLIVPQAIKETGGRSEMVPVGHSFVENAMSRTQAPLGGEQSGHFFISENYYGFDDAAYTASKLLEIFSGSEKKVSEHYKTIPQVFSYPEFRPACPDDKKFEVINQISKILLERYEVNTLDGVRVDFGDESWLGIRASNTSPVLSVLMEALSQEKLDEIRKQAEELLDQFGISL